MPRREDPDNPRHATQSRVTNSQNARPAWSPYRAKRRRICASLTVFLPVTLRVLRTGPRIEDQSGVPAHRHHDVRRRVRPHARERQQALLELRVGELVGRGGRQAPRGRARRRRPIERAHADTHRGTRRERHRDRRSRACRPSARVWGTRSRAARGRRSPAHRGARTSAFTIRTVALHVQFVVQTVFTTSSKTDGPWSIRPAPAAAHARSWSCTAFA